MIGFLEKNLTSGERIEYKTSLHWIILIPSVLSLILSAAIIIYYNRYHLGEILLTVSFMFLLTKITAYLTSDYAVTNERILMKRGFISRDFFSINHAQIEMVETDFNLLGRIFGYGAIILTGTGGSKERFINISSPLDFVKAANQMKNKP